jgi:membrane protein
MIHWKMRSDADASRVAGPGGEPGIVAAVKETWKEFSEDDAMSQAAALAFYSGLALAPLLTIAVWIAQNVLGDSSVDQIVAGAEQVVGKSAAEPIRQLLDPATEQAKGGMTISGIVSILILAFSASGVFGQLQAALNRMWDVRQKPSAGLRGLIRKRLFSFGMLLSLLFLLLVSGIAGAIIHGFIAADAAGWWIQAVQVVVTLLIFIPLFAMLFKYIPDAKIGWNDVWIGATITAVLFVAGKLALSIYLGRGSYQSSYGAAIGSFVALLVWVYYTSIIVFIGAEATQVYARRRGHEIEPEEHAERIITQTRPATA